MKHFRLILIILCAFLLLTACGTAPQKENATPEETTFPTDPTTSTDPIETKENSSAVQKLIFSLPAVKQIEIENQTRKIEVSSDGEKNGVPMNAIRILSPDGEELWKGSYEADGTVQCGIVTQRSEDDDPLKKGFIYWSVKTVPGERITATYMTYASLENGKYEKLGSILSSQGISSLQLSGLGGGKRIDISSASAYLAGKDDFINFLHSMGSKLMDGTVQFDTDGKQMQWEQWFTHEIVFNDPTTGKPTTFEIIGSDR